MEGVCKVSGSHGTVSRERRRTLVGRREDDIGDWEEDEGEECDAKIRGESARVVVRDPRHLPSPFNLTMSPSCVGRRGEKTNNRAV